MPGHRFFVELNSEAKAALGTTVALSDTDSHHARDVLRLSAGDAVIVCDKSSAVRFSGVIADTEPQVTVRLARLYEHAQKHSRVKQILFALCKGDHNDLVCEKVTELGVEVVHFFQAERSVVKISPTDIEKKLQRWKKISEGAAKQCDRGAPPEVLLSTSLKEALNRSKTLYTPNDSFFFCALTKESAELRALAVPLARIHIAVGPEGDFTPAEEKEFVTQGFKPVSLGPTVLRSETAAIAAIAMANAVWGYE